MQIAMIITMIIVVRCQYLVFITALWQGGSNLLMILGERCIFFFLTMKIQLILTLLDDLDGRFAREKTAWWSPQLEAWDDVSNSTAICKNGRFLVLVAMRGKPGMGTGVKPGFTGSSLPDL